MTEEDRFPFRRSLKQQTNTLLGGDRLLVVIGTFLSAYLGFVLSISKGLWVGVPVGFVLWSALIWVLRRMANADPMLRRVALRHFQYLPFYPARSRINARRPKLKPFIRY